jgi:copper chaperone CopZ
VRALVLAELADQVRDEPYHFCESPDCDVVYFSAKDPEHRFQRADIRVRVGQKATEPPIQVCYCFDWTTHDIEGEFRLGGSTTIPDRIRRKVQQGFCQCETMNPQGSCCLGNVNKAVKEVRDKLALLPGGTPGKPRQNDQGMAADRVPTVPANDARKTAKDAFLATLGAVVTAIVGSACCWLPLLLIAFGFSTVGVGSFFEEYRPYFLTASFALLGVAWYVTYRATIRRAWARLTGSSAPAAAVHSCCAAERGPQSCTPPGESGQPTRERLALFNQLMLWMATVIIVVIALFPNWIGLIFGAGGNSTEGINWNDQQQVVLEIQGMTCAGCAPAVEQALGNIPGVSAARVNIEKAEAVVFVPKGQDVPREAILQAVRNAGYSATFRR